MIKRTMFGHKLNARVPIKGYHTVKTPYKPNPSMPVHPIMDLTKYDNLILDQGQEGDCTAAASGGCWMYLELLKWRLANPGYTPEGFKDWVNTQLPVSMDFIYALELMHDGDFGEDVGSYGATAAWVLETFGACYDNFWPNNGDGFEENPSQGAMNAAVSARCLTYQVMDLHDLRACHSEGYPAWIGIPVFPSFVNSAEVMASGQIPMPNPFEQPAGGHELKTIGHNDTTRMILLDNSWGPGVGISGRFELPYDYFEKFGSDCHTARLLP